MWSRYGFGRRGAPFLARRTIKSVIPQDELCPAKAVANEPILPYAPGSCERKELRKALDAMAAVTEEVPIMIGDECVREGEPKLQPMPHDHATKIAQYYHASEKTIQRAIQSAVCAQRRWDREPFSTRIAVLERAADLVAGPWRYRLNAATMLGQSKTLIQAEIDSACELADFYRFHAYFLREHLKYQPISEKPSVTLNSMRLRGIDGFIAAVSPFNFSAIAGNLAYTPAMMGNCVVWKPSDAAVLSGWTIYQVMREAGMPGDVVSWVPADGPVFGQTITSHPLLAAINFTGSVGTFNWLWSAVAANLPQYRHYPRLVGECGGKNYHFVHPSADVETVVSCTIRAAFEYCGQKCSACSRMYVPESLWEKVAPCLLAARDELSVGDVADFTTFMGAVIDERAFNRITKYIEGAKSNSKNTILGGGNYSKEKGYFVCPTIIQTTDPLDRLMTEEIFGPVLTIYVYKDAAIEDTLCLVEESTRFALTGAVFAQDDKFLHYALDRLKFTAGNFYVNDKSTGAVVGQQPFGGGRMSGTNDKAGGPGYVLRWTSPQTVKETFVPLPDITYPYMTSDA